MPRKNKKNGGPNKDIGLVADAAEIEKLREVNGFTITIRGHSDLPSYKLVTELNKAAATLEFRYPGCAVKQTYVTIDKGYLRSEDEVL